jgi:hypothetical protein
MNSLNAFHGDAKQKAALIESVRERWSSGQLVPCAILKWAPDIGFYSLNAALVGGEDAQLYEERTGIPLTLALLCESMLTMAVVTTPDASKPAGTAIHLTPRMRNFGLEWLEAIRPGAELGSVLPRFMADFLAWFLSPNYALGERLEPGVRESAQRILALWKDELTGAPPDDKAWRQVRRAAVQASEACSDPWCFNLAIAVESLAWPAENIRAEFKQFFMMIMGQLSAYLQQPYLHPDDQANTVAMFGALRALAAAEQEEPMDQASTQKLFDSRPEWSQALAGRLDAAIMDRVRAARLVAMEATDCPIREMMDSMLKLLAAA